MDFAFTVKFLGKENVTKVPSDYDTVWSHWAKHKCIVLEKAFEPDSRGVCHCHGIVTIPKDFYRMKLQIMGVNAQFDVLTDKAGWRRYMHKGDKKTFNKIIIPARHCPAQRPERSERHVSEDPRILRFLENPMGYKSEPVTLVNCNRVVPTSEKLFSLLILY